MHLSPFHATGGFFLYFPWLAWAGAGTKRALCECDRGKGSLGYGLVYFLLKEGCRGWARGGGGGEVAIKGFR